MTEHPFSRLPQCRQLEMEARTIRFNDRDNIYSVALFADGGYIVSGGDALPAQ